MPREYQRGIIDPISLVALAFLVISLVVGTVAVSKPNSNFDIRKRARTVEGQCSTNSDCQTGYNCVAGSCIKNYSATPTSTPYPQLTATSIPTVIPTPPPSTLTPMPVTTPYCSKFMNDNCLYGCGPSTSGGTCIAAPTGTPSPSPIPTPSTAIKTPTPTPTPTPYCSSFNIRDCYYGCEPNLGGGYCKSAPVTPSPIATKIPTSTTTPTSTPLLYVTPIISENYGYSDCLAKGNTASECKGAISVSPTPVTQQTAAYCSSFMVKDCLYGCEPTSTGGRCKDKSDATPSSTITNIWEIAAEIPRRPLFQDCDNDFQCQSGYCNQSSGKCALNPTQIGSEFATSSGLVSPTFIQTHLAQIEANPELSNLAALDPTYNLRLLAYRLQSANSPEDIVGNAASSMFSYILNTLADDFDVLTGIDYENRFQGGIAAPYAMADILTLGGLSSVTQAATSYAGAYANAPEGDTFLNNPELFLATVNAGIQGTGAALSLVSPFTGGVPRQALQEMYQLRQSAQNSIADIANEATSVLRLPGADNPAGWTLGTYGNQTVLSNMPEGLSSSEQVIWITQEHINAGATSLPERFTGARYSPLTGTMGYEPTDITSFIGNLPEDTFFADLNRVIAQNSDNPQAALQEIANLIETTPGLEIEIVRDDTMLWYQRGSSSPRDVSLHFNPDESLSSQYSSISFQEDWYIGGIEEGNIPVSFGIRTNPRLTPYEEMRTLIHEFGHITEESQALSRLTQLPEWLTPVHISTEAVSTAYAIRFAQILAENGVSMNLAVDLATDQLELFNVILFGLASP